MKVNTLIRASFAAEYWDFTDVVDDANTRVRTYFYVRDVRFAMVPGEVGNFYVYLPESLRQGAQFRNVQDASGTEVFLDYQGDSYHMELGAPEPVFNVYNTIEAYRHELERTAL